MSSEALFDKVEVPLIDYAINDPFRVKLEEILVEPIMDLRIEAALPPIVIVEPPLLSGELVRLSIIEEFWEKGISFDDILTAVPMINRQLIIVSKKKIEVLERKLKYLRRIIVTEKPRIYRVEIKPIQRRNVPDDLRNAFTIKIKIRRELTPESKEIIENRLTKELRITRLVKRMEIVRDYRASLELELILSEIERRLGLRRLGGRPPRRAR